MRTHTRPNAPSAHLAALPGFAPVSQLPTPMKSMPGRLTLAAGGGGTAAVAGAAFSPGAAAAAFFAWDEMALFDPPKKLEMLGRAFCPAPPPSAEATAAAMSQSAAPLSSPPSSPRRSASLFLSLARGGAARAAERDEKDCEPRPNFAASGLSSPPAPTGVSPPLLLAAASPAPPPSLAQLAAALLLLLLLLLLLTLVLAVVALGA